MSNLNDDLRKRKGIIDKALDEYLPMVFPEELYRAARHLIKAGGKRPWSTLGPSHWTVSFLIRDAITMACPVSK